MEFQAAETARTKKMGYQAAVKIWNSHRKRIDPTHVYALPRKGTPEHAMVLFIRSGQYKIVNDKIVVAREAVRAVPAKNEAAKSLRATIEERIAKRKERVPSPPPRAPSPERAPSPVRAPTPRAASPVRASVPGAKYTEAQLKKLGNPELATIIRDNRYVGSAKKKADMIATILRAEVGAVAAAVDDQVYIDQVINRMANLTDMGDVYSYLYIIAGLHYGYWFREETDRFIQIPNWPSVRENSHIITIDGLNKEYKEQYERVLAAEGKNPAVTIAEYKKNQASEKIRIDRERDKVVGILERFPNTTYRRAAPLNKFSKDELKSLSDIFTAAIGAETTADTPVEKSTYDKKINIKFGATIKGSYIYGANIAEGRSQNAERAKEFGGKLLNALDAVWDNGKVRRRVAPAMGSTGGPSPMIGVGRVIPTAEPRQRERATVPLAEPRMSSTSDKK